MGKYVVGGPLWENSLRLGVKYTSKLRSRCYTTKHKFCLIGLKVVIN